MTLIGVEFVRRYVSHVLPEGFMRVRLYGFLSNCCWRKKLSLIQKQTPSATPNEEDSPRHHGACPQCKQGELLPMGLNTPPTHNQERAYRLNG